VLDDLEDPEHVFWLLSNRIIAYAGKIQRYGNFEVDEARTLVNGLKKRKIDWISLLNVDVKGVEPVPSNSNLFPDSDQEDDRPDDNDESNGIRIHGDESGESPNDSKNEEEANQKEDKKDPVKRPMLSEELIESASKLKNQFYDSFNFLRELKRMIYKFELCEETQICQRLNRAVDEVFEGFDNLAHLIQTVKELCVQKRLTDC
jgi:hypothetical protein